MCGLIPAIKSVALPTSVRLCGGAVAALVALSATGLAQTAADRAAQGPSLAHYTGLLRVPSAYVAPDGEFRFSASRHWVNHFGPRGEVPLRSLSGHMGFLPNIELGMGFSFLDDSKGVTFDDRAISAKLSLPGANGIRFAAGSTDLNGTRKFASDYAVVSAPLGRANATVGFGNGEFEGAFGGIAYPLGSNLAAIAEWDTKTLNAGVKWTSGRTTATFAANGEGRAGFGLTYSLPLNQAPEEVAPDVVTRRLSRSPISTRVPIALQFLQTTFTDQGFQDVRFGRDGETFVVSFTNGVWRDELRALRFALIQACELAPGEFKRVRIVTMREGIGVLSVETGANEYIEFANGVLTPDAYAQHIQIRGGSASLGTPIALDDDKRNSSVKTVDVQVSPRFNYQLGGENIPNKVSLVTEGYASMGGGLGLYAQGRAVVSNSLDDERGFKLDQASAEMAWSSRSGSFVRLSAGWFGDEVGGVVGEAVQLVDGGRFEVFGGAGSLLGRGVNEDFLRVGAGVRVPSLDLRLRASHQRYLGGDSGEQLEATRSFGRGDLTVYVGQTKNNADDKTTYGGFNVTFGLGESFAKPGTLRIRPADEFDFGYLATENAVPLGDKRRVLRSGRSIHRDLLSRETLVPAFVMAHLDRLRSPRRNLGFPPEEVEPLRVIPDDGRPNS